ncbi:DUF5709 domain-containing protein [Streptomyces sp. N2-109]|uniref:DUF5709 domain-containing protein n=1 Tax=Streptomyces gossypii TaxID=2883101 RepID=A0ABT2K0R7_9ACTN|nr:DUF5709 domain-containing protein [Streptomyces gossypii]MCT2593224.1 DUF5709 domain-containing protein [Streptomyces gossypii]
MANGRGDDVYQPDEAEVQDDAGVLEPEDTLVDRGVSSSLDEGYSPPEKPLAVENYGTTAAEQHEGEPLEDRLSRETLDVGETAYRSGVPGGAEGEDEWATEDLIDAGAVDENVVDDEMIDETTDIDGMTARDEPTDEEILDADMKGQRAGRLVAPDEGAHADEEKDAVAEDVGIAGSAASAEEAGMHIVSEPPEPPEPPEPYTPDDRDQP